MNLHEYAAQGAQEALQTQETQPAEFKTADQLADRMQADRLSSLLDNTQAMITDNAAPADLLRGIIAEMFGENSTQAAAVEDAIKKDKMPGGYSLYIASLRERKRLLRRQLDQLNKMEQGVLDMITEADTEEVRISLEAAKGAGYDRALTDIMEYSHLFLKDPQPDLIPLAERLFDRYGSSPAAMGLLYGCLCDMSRTGYAARAFDIMQQQEFETIKEKIATAIK